MNRTTLLTIVALGTALSISTAQAADVTWNGLAGNNLWADGGNWVGGSPPVDDDFSDRAVFPNSVTPATISVPNGQSIRDIRFNSAGWDLDPVGNGQFEDIRDFSSEGAGINRVGYFEQRNVNSIALWEVASGNTLEFYEGLRQPGRTARVFGGGTLLIGSSIDGFGTPRLLLEDITIRFEDNTPYNPTNGFVRFDDVTAVLELQTSVANAQSQIGDEIIDNTGLGLQVTDIGGGFVQIAVIPEPASVVLAMAGGLMLLGRRRR